MKKNIRNIKKEYVLVFGICLLTHAIINPFVKTLCSLPTEMASLAVASYGAGYNWTNLLKDMDYFGNGFYAIMLPFMVIIKNPFWIHQVTMLIAATLNAIPSLLCYSLMKTEFENRDDVFCIWTAVLISFIDCIPTIAAINEHPLRLITWICIYLLIKLVNNNDNGKTIKYSIIIAMLLGYSILVHERALALVGVVSIFLIVFYIVYRYWLVKPLLFYPVLFISIATSRFLVKLITTNLWQTSEGSSLRNSNGTISKIFSLVKLLFDKDGIKGFLNTFFGQLFTGNVFSLGLFFIVIIVSYIVFKESVRLIFERKKGEAQLQKEFIICFICLMTSLGTVAANGVLNIEAAKILIERATGAKFYFFLRYYFLYLSPLFMLGIIYIKEKFSVLNKYLILLLVLNQIVSMYVLTFILPTTITGPSSKFDAAFYISAFVFRQYQELVRPAYILVYAFIPFLCYLGIWLLKKYNLRKVCLIVFLILFMYQYYYIEIVQNINIAERNYEYIDAYKEQIYALEEYDERTRKLCVLGSDYMAQIAQYEMPDLYISHSVNDEFNEVILSGVVLSERAIKEYGMNYWYCLDENEYLYSRERIYNFMERIKDE